MISSPTLHRVPRYYRYLEALKKRGFSRTSSVLLAKQMGVTASQIRQDLASFGEFGQQGFGYRVTELMDELGEILGMANQYRVAFIGAGHLAKGLAANFPFERYGISVTALYDIDPAIVGTTMFGLPVYHIDDLKSHLKVSPIDIGILTVPESAAEKTAEMLSECGVKGIWNFTNVELHPGAGTLAVEDVHLFDSLFSLCCRVNGYSAELSLPYKAN